MTMRKTIFTAAISAVALMASSSASAATYLVNYTTNAGLTAFSGTLTTTNTADLNGFFTITGLTGSRTTAGIASAVALLVPNSVGGNNNLFKPTANYFDINGFAYSAGGLGFNPYYNGSLNECRGTTTNGSGCSLGAQNAVANFTVTAAVVPEPATWGMMFLGFGMIGAAARYRRRSTKVSFA